MPSRKLLASLALLGIAAAWGSTFYLIHDLLDRVPVADFLAVRFAIASVAMLLVAPRAIPRLSPQARRYALVLGTLYGVAQILQTTGLAHTPASVSGFITGLYVVITPLLAALLLHTRIGGVPPLPGSQGMPPATVSSRPWPEAENHGPKISVFPPGSAPAACQVRPPSRLRHSRHRGVPAAAPAW